MLSVMLMYWTWPCTWRCTTILGIWSVKFVGKLSWEEKDSLTTNKSKSYAAVQYVRLCSRSTVARYLTKMAKNPQIIFFEIYHFYYVFCFPVMWDDLPKHFWGKFQSFRPSNSQLFWDCKKFFLDSKCILKQTSPKINLKHLWKIAQISWRKCVLVGKIEF